ncbi:ribonuclease Z [Gemmiger sp.]
MLKVTLLGTGGTQPLPDRALAAAAVTVGGHSVLLDCGEGTQVGLRRYGVSAYRLSAVLLTHYHGDHILGLPGLLQTLGSLNRTEPLTIYGPKGIDAVAGPVMALAGPQAFPVRWQATDEPFTVDTLKITPFPLTHRVPCQGYVLELPRAGKFDPARAKAAGIPMAYWSTLQSGESVGGFTPAQVLGAPRRGLKVVYATDTRPCAALEAAAQDADLLCMDATYADDADLPKAKLYGHATCREVGALAAAARVRRLWLTHYSAAVTDTAPGQAAARTAYPNALAGYDGLCEELEFDKT